MGRELSWRNANDALCQAWEAMCRVTSRRSTFRGRLTRCRIWVGCWQGLFLAELRVNGDEVDAPVAQALQERQVVADVDAVIDSVRWVGVPGSQLVPWAWPLVFMDLLTTSKTALRRLSPRAVG